MELARLSCGQSWDCAVGMESQTRAIPSRPCILSRFDWSQSRRHLGFLVPHTAIAFFSMAIVVGSCSPPGSVIPVVCGSSHRKLALQHFHPLDLGLVLSIPSLSRLPCGRSVACCWGSVRDQVEAGRMLQVGPRSTQHPAKQSSQPLTPRYPLILNRTMSSRQGAETRDGLANCSVAHR